MAQASQEKVHYRKLIAPIVQMSSRHAEEEDDASISRRALFFHIPWNFCKSLFNSSSRSRAAGSLFHARKARAPLTKKELTSKAERHVTDAFLCKN